MSAEKPLLLEARKLTKTFPAERSMFGFGPKVEPAPVLHGVSLAMEFCSRCTTCRPTNLSVFHVGKNVLQPFVKWPSAT